MYATHQRFSKLIILYSKCNTTADCHMPSLLLMVPNYLLHSRLLGQHINGLRTPVCTVQVKRVRCGAKGHKDQGWAIGLGALYGAAIGANIGKSLDERDKQLADDAFQSSLENNKTGAPSSWSNPDSGHSGETTPTRTYTADSGDPCREFTTTVLIGGEEQQGYGTACRQSDGSWKIVN